MLNKLILLLLIVSSSYCDVIILNENNVKLSILENSKVFIDTSSKLNFKEIQNKNFTDIKKNYLREGYTEHNIWVKFSIKNNSKKELERYLTLTNPMLDIIELYTKDKNSFTKEAQGILNLDLYDRNNILHPSFKILFKAQEVKEFYYKTHSISSANYFKLFLKDSKQLYKDEFSYQLIESLFFGALIALLLYNVFILIFTKEISYLYYVLYIFFIAINHSSYSIMLDYFLGEEYSHIDAFLAVYYLSFATIFALLFINHILNIKNYTKLYFVSNTLILANVILMILSTQRDYLIQYATHLMFISVILIIFLTGYATYKKVPTAKYIFIAWIINVLGLFSLALKQYGIINFIDYFDYFYEVCTITEAILFSIALASKLNRTKDLEKAVSSNKILTKELHHRVKNNMQFIILMYRLKLSSFNDKEISNKLKEIEGSIQAISKTHEILYKQDNLEEINTKLYLEDFIYQLKKSLNMKDIDITLSINAKLNIQKSIYCGMILNELITNSYKYAFNDLKGRIDVSLTQENNKTYLLIKDDGKGFNLKEKETKSFGLSFIRTLCENELGGSFNINTSKGVSVKIDF